MLETLVTRLSKSWAILTLSTFFSLSLIVVFKVYDCMAGFYMIMTQEFVLSYVLNNIEQRYSLHILPELVYNF